MLISTSDYYNSPEASSVFGTSGRHTETISQASVEWSPRVRGWSRHRRRVRRTGPVVPARAGVFPPRTAHAQFTKGGSVRTTDTDTEPGPAPLAQTSAATSSVKAAIRTATRM
ncbi:hypothetical protein SCMC78_31010 [Streptomyces sp. CMC78]|uniref:Uncharacterized protein n=1 Tax=Streptomyces sp. CMC78 TaxID=3231512 RepID=A0AB33KHQ2_9ACTN